MNKIKFKIKFKPDLKLVFFLLAVGFALLAEVIFGNPDLSWLGRCRRCVIMQVPAMLFAICALYAGRNSPWWQKFVCEFLLFVVAFECYFRVEELLHL